MRVQFGVSDLVDGETAAEASRASRASCSFEKKLMEGVMGRMTDHQAKSNGRMGGLVREDFCVHFGFIGFISIGLIRGLGNISSLAGY